MYAHLFSVYSLQLDRLLDNVSYEKIGLVKMTFLCMLVTLFFHFPSYDLIVLDPSQYDPILKQIDRPFQFVDYHTESHQAKLMFRIVPPLLAKALGGGILGCLILQLVSLFFVILYIQKNLLKLQLSAVSVNVATLAFCFVYPTSFLCFDYKGCFDGVAYAFMAAALYHSSYVRALCISLAILTDERSVFIIPLLYLYDLACNDFKTIWKPKELLWLALALGIALGVRWSMAHYLGFVAKLGGVSPTVFIDQINNVPVGFWSSIEGFWILIAGALYALYKKHKVAFWGYLLVNLAIVFCSYWVHDITRSMAYIYPSIFVALSIHKNSNVPLEAPLKVVLLVCVLSAGYHVACKDEVTYLLPFPLQAARMLNTYCF